MWIIIILSVDWPHFKSRNRNYPEISEWIISITSDYLEKQVLLHTVNKGVQLILSLESNLEVWSVRLNFFIPFDSIFKFYLFI